MNAFKISRKRVDESNARDGHPRQFKRTQVWRQLGNLRDIDHRSQMRRSDDKDNSKYLEASRKMFKVLKSAQSTASAKFQLQISESNVFLREGSEVREVDHFREVHEQ